MTASELSLFAETRDCPYTQGDFEAIAAMVHAHAGICLPEGKAMLVYSRLAKLVRARALDSFSAYVDVVRHDPVERARAIEALTTNHTKFFRENHHFDHFADVVRPALLSRLGTGERVRLWSSAASSGEEPYSLAMVLLGTDPGAARRILEGDIAILGTDLADHALATAQAGRYPAASVADIPTAYRDCWTTLTHNGFQIDARLRKLVALRKLNLLNPWPMNGVFDVIFCRNVMIYFDEPTKEKLLSRLADQLRSGGYLYIGHSERLVGKAAQAFSSIGQTIYLKDRA